MPSQRNTIWNRCDVCGRFIAYSDFDEDIAVRKLVTPDSDYSVEEYITLCWEHRIDKDL